MFGLDFNDLAAIKSINWGVELGNVKVRILLYADDMILYLRKINGLAAHVDCYVSMGFKLEINIDKSSMFKIGD